MDVELENLIDSTSELAVAYGFQVLGAIAVLIVGLLLARWLPNLVRRACERRPQIDPTLTPFFTKLTKILVLLVTLMAVLQNVGINIASFLAVAGAIGLGVGLALKDTLADLAAGIVLLVLRPFGVGDFIEAGGTMGSVTEISFFATQLKAPDGTFTLVPNSKIWGDVIHNKTVNPTRRIDLTVGIGYGEDMDQAVAVAREVVAAEPRVLPDPEPLVAVTNFGDSSVELLVRVWTTTADWWPAQLDLRKRLKERLDEAGVEIPFPQRDLHVHWSSPPTEPGTGEGAAAPAA